MRRVALLSLHTSPLALLGGRETGGMNVYVREVATRLARRGIAVDVFTRRVDPTTPQVESLGDGARLIRIAAGRPAPLPKEALAAYVPAFAAGVAAFGAREGRHYDLYYSHYWLSAAAGELLTADLAAPHITMFHTLAAVKRWAGATGGEGQPQDPPERVAGEAALVASVDRIVAATEHERTMLHDLHGVAPERVAVIPLGVDVTRFQPGDRAASRRALGLHGEQPVILSVGRLEELKGFDLLIDALAMMRVPARLVLLGGDARSAAERDRLRGLAASAGVADRVIVPGAVPHEALRQWYTAADLVAMPSRYESFGLVAVEAMACGTPVIASHVGGLAATVVDGETGMLIDWRCAPEFAGAFDALLGDPERRRTMGIAARRRALTFGWEGVVDQLEALCTDLVGAVAPTVPHESSGQRGGRLPVECSA